jgi:hypothetical protein
MLPGASSDRVYFELKRLFLRYPSPWPASSARSGSTTKMLLSEMKSQLLISIFNVTSIFQLTGDV